MACSAAKRRGIVEWLMTGVYLWQDYVCRQFVLSLLIERTRWPLIVLRIGDGWDVGGMAAYTATAQPGIIAGGGLVHLACIKIDQVRMVGGSDRGPAEPGDPMGVMAEGTGDPAIDHVLGMPGKSRARRQQMGFLVTAEAEGIIGG